MVSLREGSEIMSFNKEGEGEMPIDDGYTKSIFILGNKS